MIWRYAEENGFVIVTKDSDFQELCSLRGAPPKVVWLRVGNTSKGNVIPLLTKNHEAIEASFADEGTHCLELE